MSVQLQPGHGLAVQEFEPRVRLWADGSEPDVGLELTDREIMTWLKSDRSEERRVGKECRIGCRSRWSPYH